MISCRILTALTCVRTCSQFVHGQTDGFVSLLAQCTETHGSCHKVLYDLAHGLHLVDGDRIPAEIHEVADKDGVVLLIHQFGEFLELLIIACSRRKLQRGDGLRIPGMPDAILAPMELSLIGQSHDTMTRTMSCLRISSNLFKSDAPNGAHLRSKIGFQQRFRQSYTFKDLCSSITADGRNAHLRHNLEQSLLHCLDVVGLSSGVVFLDLTTLDEVVQNGKCHIGTQCRSTIAQQQRGMHGLMNLARLHNQCRLDTLAHTDQIVMHGTHCQKTRYCHMLLIHVTVSQDDVVVSFIYRLLSTLAELVERRLQVVGEKHRQLDGVEAFVANIAQNVKLRVVQYRVRQTHHLAVRLVGSQNTCSYTSDIFGQRHHQLLANGVDGGVGHLCKLLAEVVEEHLWLVTEHSQRRIVAHRGRRLLPRRCHRDDGGRDCLFGVAEYHFLLQQIVHAILHMPAALQFLKLYAVGRKPLTIRMFRSQLLLDLSVVVDLTLLRIDEQDLAWLQSSLLGNLCRVEVHNANLRGNYHRTVCCDHITCGSQSITVEHASCITTIGEQQRCRTIPRLHQDGMVFIISLQIFADGVLVVKRLGHQYAHRMGKREAAHHQKFQHIVERSRIRHLGLNNGGNVTDVSQGFAVQHRLAGLHPSTIATYGIDFTIVCKQTEWLRQRPCGEGIGAESRMYQRQSTGKVGTAQVGEILSHLHR